MGAVALGLPASVALDSALDSSQQRVHTTTNVDANGVRAYVARPASSATGSVKRPAVIVIHQVLHVHTACSAC